MLLPAPNQALKRLYTFSGSSVINGYNGGTLAEKSMNFFSNPQADNLRTAIPKLAVEAFRDPRVKKVEYSHKEHPVFGDLLIIKPFSADGQKIEGLIPFVWNPDRARQELSTTRSLSKLFTLHEDAKGQRHLNSLLYLKQMMLAIRRAKGKTPEEIRGMKRKIALKCVEKAIDAEFLKGFKLNFFAGLPDRVRPASLELFMAEVKVVAAFREATNTLGYSFNYKGYQVGFDLTLPVTEIGCNIKFTPRVGQAIQRSETNPAASALPADDYARFARNLPDFQYIDTAVEERTYSPVGITALKLCRQNLQISAINNPDQAIIPRRPVTPGPHLPQDNGSAADVPHDPAVSGLWGSMRDAASNWHGTPAPRRLSSPPRNVAPKENSRPSSPSAKKK